MQEEFKHQANDPNWKPSREDLLDMITITKITGGDFTELIGEGTLAGFRKIS
jgi:hypothetical protein